MSFAIMLASITAVALAVKDAGFVVSFTGALMGTAILYVFPTLMFLRWTKGEVQPIRRLERNFCRFLVGFGAAGIDPDKTFSSDSAEALRDLAQIAQVSSADPDDVVEDDDQEADYVELSEYVRVVALTFYTEHNAMSTEKSAQNLH